MVSNYLPFDLSALTDVEQAIVQGALDVTKFNFKALIPGLEAQVRRNTIPVLFSDLSRYHVKSDTHSHSHDDEAHSIDRVFEGRKRVLGLAYYAGKVEIEKSLASADPRLAAEVFLAEGAHMVDFFLMTDAQRKKIFDIYHGGEAIPHDHGWFEETGNHNYWSWVGESFMYGFIAAFSTVQGTGDAFIHRTTPEIGTRIREVFQPPKPIVARAGSKIAHRKGGWHERQISDVLQNEYETLDEAERAGLRACKTCRWVGL